MGAYSKLEPDQKILDELRGNISTLIVGCANCANISLAHDKDLPVYHIETNKKTGKKTSEPVAVFEEAKRIQRLLKNQGTEAQIEVSRYFCMPSVDNPQVMKAIGHPPDLKDREVDSVVVLTCNLGLNGAKNRVKNGINVVWGIKIFGGHEPFLSHDVATGNIYVDKKRSKF